MRATTLAVLLFSCATATPAPALRSAPADSPPALRLPDAVRPLRYAATLTVDPDAERFTGEIAIDVRLATSTRTIWLHARGLDIDRVAVTVHGEPLKAEARVSGEELVGVLLPSPIGPGDVKVTLAYRGPISSTEWSGLFREKSGGDWYAFTQLEPTDARRVFPCFDEPAFKVPWRLKLKVPRGLTAASNTPADNEWNEGALHVIHFAATRPLPSYLIAFAVGPFERVDLGAWGGHRTPISALVTKGHAGELGLAKEAMGPGLERLERYFGMPYPYDKLDLVSVPLFIGGMENAGLILARADQVLSTPEAVTPSHRRSATSLLLHETAHQWFGDLVTMAWWNDLWLNETFADWVSTRVVDDWHPEWERAVFRAGDIRAGAMSADSLPSAPAVRQSILPQDIGSLAGGSYGITYLKGQEVLTMAEGWIGREDFRDGIRAYLNDHLDGTATAPDLWAALEIRARRDVAPVLSTFVDQAGLPLVTAELHCDPGLPPRLHFAQRRYLRLGVGQQDRRTWKIPLCVRYPAAVGAARECAVMDRPEMDLLLTEATDCPAWVVPNDGALGYFRVSLPPELWASLLGGAAPLSRPERVAFLGDLFALVASGDLPAADALAQLPAVARSGDHYQVRQAVRFTRSSGDTVVTDALRPRFVKMAREVFGPPARALGLRPRPGEDEEARLLRDTLLEAAGEIGDDPELRSGATRLAEEWLQDHRSLPREVLRRVLGLAAAGGDAALYDRLAAAALKSEDAGERDTLFSALGAFRAPELVQRNFDLLLSGKIDPREAVEPFLFESTDWPQGREVAYAFVKTHFEELAAKLPSEQVEALLSVGQDFCDAAHRKDVERSLGPRAARIPHGDRQLAKSLDLIDACIAARERQQASAAAFLQRYERPPAHR